MVPFHEIGIVAIAAAVTMALRFLPFFVFRGDRPMPEGLRYLAGVLPCAMIGMLVIYCLRCSSTARWSSRGAWRMFLPRPTGFRRSYPAFWLRFSICGKEIR